MRDFHTPGRSAVMSTRGMAATSHPSASLTAINILQAGGNAMDAAIGACAVQCVVEPGSTGIGGDCFALFAAAGTDRLIAFNGSGRAPSGASAQRLRDLGLTEIPRQSPHSVTIPGAVDAWAQLSKRHGRMSLREVLQPAIHFAEHGYAVTARVHADWSDQQPLLARDAAARQVFLPDGTVPPEGTIHRQPALAQTLKLIADHGPDAFYSGVVAADIVGYLQGLGGLHTLGDFTAVSGEYVTPISAKFRGYDVYECPPNNHAIVALIMLNILAGLPHDAPPTSAERLHLEIEAARQAYALRDALIGDPAHSPMPVPWLLSEELAGSLRARIDPARASDIEPAYPTYPHTDTVYISVVDKDRNAVSFINSLFNPYGSGLLAPGSGVLLQNRGQGFSLTAGHPNELAPGKRPLHTIMPGMLMRDGRVQMSFGVMGGHYQPMGQVHLLTKVLDYQFDLQSAVDLPRLFPLPGTRTVEVEHGIPAATIAGLRDRGYDIVPAERPIGGAQAIWIDWDTGVLTGASDPRKDGCALGY
jgi:gamma-glutamyltranspeptidase / glutathione hydrolase